MKDEIRCVQDHLVIICSTLQNTSGLQCVDDDWFMDFRRALSINEYNKVAAAQGGAQFHLIRK
jgi:hypothetical protein